MDQQQPSLDGSRVRPAAHINRKAIGQILIAQQDTLTVEVKMDNTSSACIT